MCGGGFSWSSLNQLSDMSENEDVLLEFFVRLPQFKQVTGDKEELISSIVDMASKFLSHPGRQPPSSLQEGAGM